MYQPENPDPLAVASVGTSLIEVTFVRLESNFVVVHDVATVVMTVKHGSLRPIILLCPSPSSTTGFTFVPWGGFVKKYLPVPKKSQLWGYVLFCRGATAAVT